MSSLPVMLAEFRDNRCTLDKRHCGRCRMSFQIATPPGERGEYLSCPDCNQRFWAVMRDDNIIRIGILPQDCLPFGIGRKVA